MDSTVKTRPNHYELLGLAPSASDKEIMGAFARAMGLFRPMTASAQIGLAYEVLRDPARRRAYDDALGLRPEPRPIEAPRAVAFRSSGHFNAATMAEAPPAPGPREQPDHVREVWPEPESESVLEPRPEPETMREPNPGSFIAASLRRADARPIAPPLPRRADAATNVESDEEGVDWHRPLLAIGGVVLAAAAIGAWAGMDAGSDAEAQARAQAVTVPVPRAAPAAAVTPDPVQAQPRRRGRAHAFRRAGRWRHAAAKAQAPAAADPAPGEASTADPLAPANSLLN